MKSCVFLSLMLLALIIVGEATQHQMNPKHIEQLKQKYHQNIQMKIEKEPEVTMQTSVKAIKPNHVLIQQDAPVLLDARAPAEEENEKPQATDDNEWIRIAKETANCEEFYTTYLTQVQTKLSELQSQKTSRNAECTGYSTEITTLETEIEKLELYIVWLKEKIATNVARVDKIYADRCDAHQIFIEYYKNSKITLRLIDFLKKAIDNYSFVQLKQVGNIITEFMDPRIMTNKDAIEVMLTQLKQVDASDVARFDATGQSLDDKEVQRTDEEIGTKHVDDGRENIDLDEFDSTKRKSLETYKQEIRQILDTLRNKILAEIDRRQNDEIELNDKTAAFQEKMDIENSFLQADIDRQQATLTSFKQDLDVAKFNLETCQADVEWLSEVIIAQESIVENVTNEKETILDNCELLMNPPANSAKLSPPPRGDLAGSAEMGDKAEEEAEEEEQQSAEEEEAKVDEIISPDFVPQASDEPVELKPQGNGVRIPDVALDSLLVGLGWEALYDLDSGVLLTDENNQIIESVWWNQLESSDPNAFIIHKGDNLTGEGDGDDETIDFALKYAPANVHHCYVAIQMYDDYAYFKDVQKTRFSVYVNGVTFLTYMINPDDIPLSKDAATTLLVEFFRNKDDSNAWYIKSTNIWINPINDNKHCPGVDCAIRTLDLESTSQTVPLQTVLDAYSNGNDLPSYAVVQAPQ